MPDLNELLAQKAALEQQIIDARREQRASAIANVRALMAEHGLTMADLGSRPGASPRKAGGGKVAPKFRNPATGDTWSGRGLQPNWLKAALAGGSRLEDFKI
jgi:DNA-binding protein H-NS